jgi:hypothetical protein
MTRMPRFLSAAPAALAALLFLSACGNFTLDDPPSSSGSASRRIYVNDQAVNDSLTPDIVRSGVKFVLQPGHGYQLTLESTPRTKDKLQVYYFNDGIPRLYRTLGSASTGSEEIFSFSSDQPTAQFFMAQLSPPEGAQAIGSLHRVTLASAAIHEEDTIHVRLMFIRKLRALPDSAAKIAFAGLLFEEMAKIYAPFGIVLDGTYDIVEPAAPAFVFPFSNTYIGLPGNRVRNNAHLYMVDSISIGDPGSGLVGEVLGFAPREVVDIDTHRESRVLLSSRVLRGLTMRDAAINLAITATHELGHFFGLRHTVSTRHDLLQDEDFSNVEDGFTDTRMCQLDIALAKATAPAWLEGFHTPYCLRVADNSCSNLNCEINNLMHPVDCGTRNQTHLSPQQIAFLKTTLATYKR